MGCCRNDAPALTLAEDTPMPIETRVVLRDKLPLPPNDMIELDADSIAAVAGGLNPQPLPPGRVERLD